MKTLTYVLSAAALMGVLAASEAQAVRMGLTLNGKNLDGLTLNGELVNGLTLGSVASGSIVGTTVILADGTRVELK